MIRKILTWQLKLLIQQMAHLLKKASVALSGLGGAAVKTTNDDGICILRFKKTDFDLKSGEGYLRLDVKGKWFPGLC